jgi:spermidine synthase
MKSTVEEIRQRFDADVQRFSNLETGQSATVDAPLAMALVAEAAAATTPHARHILDVGCGAGTWLKAAMEFGKQRGQFAEAGSDRVENRHLGREMRFLIDIGNLQPLLHDQ